MAKPRTNTGKGRRAQQTTAGRGRLNPGEVLRGTIVDHDYVSRTYSVKMNGQICNGAVDMSANISALFGFKQHQQLAPGTSVVVLVGLPCWIIGTGAEDQPDTDSHRTSTMTGLGLPSALAQINPANTRVPPNSAPEDLYQGEFDIASHTGTFFRFLLFMSSLGAGERAKIEFHLLRDMVRIVSRNFEHFAATGDIKIFDDGRLSQEENATSYDHERWGLEKPTDPKWDATDTGMPAEVDALRTGRWRYTRLLGFLGDMFNSWFTDPVKTLGQMSEDAFRSGKARLHIGTDGTILGQSTADVVLEHVTRIPVPIRIRHEEDPKGVLRKHMDDLDKTFLKEWDQGGNKAEHHTLFKVREYVRYLNQYHSLARIHQMAVTTAGQEGKDWKVPTELETPEPDAGAGEADRTAANSTTYYKDCYATIRIFRDGSTLTLDAYGNATCSGPYGIIHSSTRHWQVFAAGDIVMKAGGGMFLSALRYVELVATRGSLLMKARTGLRGLCERGTLWMKSDFDPANPYTPAEGFPAAEVCGNQGIRIQATNGESRWISKLKARFLVDKNGEKLDLSCNGEVLIAAKEKLTLKSVADITIYARGSVGVIARDWLNKLTGAWALQGVCKLARGRSTFNQIKCMGMMSTGPVAAPRRGAQMVGESTCCYRNHDNHIGVYTGDPDSLNFGDVATPPPPEQETGGFSWSMAPANEYLWTNAGMAPGKDGIDLLEPISQQTLRIDQPEEYDSWPKMADKLLQAEQTSTDTPWPGATARWKIHANPWRGGISLNSPASQKPSEFSASIQTPLTSVSPVFHYLKKS